jgi:flavin reductase (NADH)
MSRRPIDARVHSRGSAPADDQGTAEAGFKEAMARWPSGVAVVAVRDPDDGQVHATTVSSLGGVSSNPPLLTFSLGAGAQVLPFLDLARRFVVNILGAGQKDLASRFTDSFPVGVTAFSDEGDPFLPGGHAHLLCDVTELIPVESSRLVVGRVLEASAGPEPTPLVFYAREYRLLR